MAQSLSNTLIHFVFSTNYRPKFIDDSIESSLFGYIGSVCNNLNCKTIIVGGYRDHVHVLCRLYRPLSQSNLVKEIKVNSSKWMKTKGRAYRNFYWQDGYAIFSVSQYSSGGLVHYIKNQREHHQKKAFQGEHRDLLDKHEIEYDERYVWD